MISIRLLAASAAVPLVVGWGATTGASVATAAPAPVPVPTVDVSTDNTSAAAPKVRAGTRVVAGYLLNQLTVRSEMGRYSYDRSKFDHWTTLRGQCDTRVRVLRAESVKRMAGGCSTAGGRWFNEYTGKYVNTASRVDIDHRVPLAEAWRSGANQWSADRRRGFANDLGYSHSLLAVGSRVNRSKSDQDPYDWLPSASPCKYVARWVAVKYRWDLRVDRDEKRAILDQLSQCSKKNKMVVVPTKGKNQAKFTPAPSPNPGTPSGSSSSTSAPPRGTSCPAGYPIKGNQGDDEWIYHVPGGAYYDRTTPEECFATEAAARAAGYRASKLRAVLR